LAGAEGDVATERREFHPLTSREVEARVAAGRVNIVDTPESRSVASILRANILTRFNAIIGVLLVVILVLGHPIDALFGLVMIINALIGIVQEMRAKLTLDRLTLLVAPRVTVRRAGGDEEISVDDIVIDDLLLLARGLQIPVDAIVVDDVGLEVSEALITGEPDPIAKPPGTAVMSGSFVVSGTAIVGVTAVGADAYANTLSAQAKQFSLSKSELRVSIDQILRIVTWLIVPTSALLLWSQLQSGQSIAQGVVGAVAGVVAMVPQGLVLLVSVSLAVAVVALGRRNVLVQELPAVETLARVDTICVDKTGTLTSGAITFAEVVVVSDSGIDVSRVLGAIGASDPDPNATIQALRDAYPTDDPAAVESRIAFSSTRKTSAVAFSDGTAWVLGAPEFVLDASIDGAIEADVARFADQGKRVLVLAPTSPDAVAAGSIDPGPPALLLVFSEEIRSDAAATIEFFTAQGVDVKVISGDGVNTVAAVAEHVGVPGTVAIDASTLPDPDTPEFSRVVDETTIFGRVKPEQKRAIVIALQEQGKTVAMTGDGVNDVLALKQAEMGIAMGSGSGATRAVAQIVLLDDRFESLPHVVAEGRRVVANMERVASLFLTKTVYATLLAILIGFIGLVFPFLPRHMTLVGAVTIGIPAFVLSFEKRSRPIRSGFLRRVLAFAIPAGLVSGLFLFVMYGISRIDRFGFTLAQSRTAATTLMIVLGLIVLFELVRPPSTGHLILIGSLFVGYLIVLALPLGQRIFDLEPPGVYAGIVIAAVALIAALVMKALLHYASAAVERRLAGDV
jgi:cation-transporting ATPase E